MLEAIYSNNVMNRLVSRLARSQDDMRKWILLAIYILLVKNFDRYREKLADSTVLEAVNATVNSNWSYWRYNAAERIQQLHTSSKM